MTENTLQGKTIAFLVASEGIEQVELTEPWKAVQEAGGTPRLLAPESGEVQAFHHLDKADTFPVDEVVADADPMSYDALVLPGGVANPDTLRTDPAAVVTWSAKRLLIGMSLRTRYHNRLAPGAHSSRFGSGS